jgi:hypothetical protein
MRDRCMRRRASLDAANRKNDVIGDAVKTAFARHSRVGGNPVPCDFDKTSHWIPAFAGMTNSEVQA